MQKISWHCKPFNELTVTELYRILQLRAEIFVVEQNCVYLDPDGVDLESHHLFAVHNDSVVAHTRLIPAGISYPEQSIGRVVVKKEFRASGLGKELMKRSIEKSHELFEKHDIKIGAQLYLKKFYDSLGFEQCSDIYDEDGIDHIKMIHRVQNHL